MKEPIYLLSSYVQGERLINVAQNVDDPNDTIYVVQFQAELKVGGKLMAVPLKERILDAKHIKDAFLFADKVIKEATEKAQAAIRKHESGLLIANAMPSNLPSNSGGLKLVQ